MNREGGFFDKTTIGDKGSEGSLATNKAPRDALILDEPASPDVTAATSGARETSLAEIAEPVTESSEQGQKGSLLKLSPRLATSDLRLSPSLLALSSKPDDAEEHQRRAKGMKESEGSRSAATAIGKESVGDESDEDEDGDGDPHEPASAAAQHRLNQPLKQAPGALLSDDKATAKKGKKSWRKPEGMPKRPLSAYNLYFRVERQRMLGDASTAPGGDEPQALARSIQVAAATSVAATATLGATEKRKHRRTHGKIGFADMAKVISEKWKAMKREERLPYEVEASQEKQRYRREVERWKSTPKRLLDQQEEQRQRQLSEDEIVRMVSLDKSGSEDNKESSFAVMRSVATATSPEDGDQERRGQGGRLEADWEAKVAAAAAMSQVRAARTAVAPSQSLPSLPLEPSSPRSETAALLIAMPTAGKISEAAGASSHYFPPQSSPPPPQTGGGGFLDSTSLAAPTGGIGPQPYLGALAGYGYATAPFGSTGAQQTSGLSETIPPYGITATGIAPSIPQSTFQYEYRHAADLERRRILEDRYRLHMAEAASLRAELERQQQAQSLLPLAIAPASAMLAPQPRRYSDPMLHAHETPVELRRFSSNPQEIALAPRQQYMFQQSGASQGLYAEAPATASQQQQQQRHQELYQLQAPLISQYGFSAPPTSSIFTSESLAVERAAIERARQDLLALERAAELRRADLARWNQQAAPSMAAPSAPAGPPPSWGAPPSAHPLAQSMSPTSPALMRATPQFLTSNPLEQQHQLLLFQQHPQQPPPVDQPNLLYSSSLQPGLQPQPQAASPSTTAAPLTVDPSTAGEAFVAQSTSPAPVQHHPGEPSRAPPTAPTALPPS